MRTRTAIIGLAALLGATAPAMAQQTVQEDAGLVTTSVVVRNGAVTPETPAQARRLLGRIQTAALTACGAERGSLVEMKKAVRGSQCWHEAVADAVARTGNPALAQLAAGTGRSGGL